VVTAQQEKVLLKFNLVGQQQNNCLERLLATVHIVTKEQVVSFWGISSVFKKSKQVSELAMHVTADLDGCFELKENGLLHKDLPGGFAKQGNILLLDCYAFTMAIYQLIDKTVDVKLAHII